MKFSIEKKPKPTLEETLKRKNVKVPAEGDFEKKHGRKGKEEMKAPQVEPSGGDWREEEFGKEKSKRNWIAPEDVVGDTEDSIIDKIDNPEEIPEEHEYTTKETIKEIMREREQVHSPEVIELNPKAEGKIGAAHAGEEEVLLAREDQPIVEGRKNSLSRAVLQKATEPWRGGIKTKEKDYSSGPKTSLDKFWQKPIKKIRGTPGSKKGRRIVPGAYPKENLKTIPPEKKQKIFRDKIRGFIDKYFS